MSDNNKIALEEEKELSRAGAFAGTEIVSDTVAVRAQLDRILADPSFRTSKRHSRFLRFVVGETLSGRAESVKERVIATEVFDRASDYDASVDPIVRVAAHDIRKRIAQYYVRPGRESELRIDLNAGSYVPTFRWPEAQPPPLPPNTEEPQVPVPVAQPLPIDSAVPYGRSSGMFGRNRRAVLLAVVCALSVLAAGVWYLKLRPEAQLATFWKPFLSSPTPPFICLGDVLSVHGRPEPAPSSNPTLSNWFSEANHIAFGDASALAELTGPFHRSQKPFRFLMADSVNFADLRGQPLVLIGLGGNPWTKRFIMGLRYTVKLDPQTNDYEVSDDQAHSPSPWHFSFNMPLNSTTRDYGIITRFSNASIEQPTMIVAGIGPYATTGAAEFITNPQYFAEFVRSAPRHWEDKNIQIVIQTEVVNGQSGPPHMVARFIW